MSKNMKQNLKKAKISKNNVEKCGKKIKNSNVEKTFNKCWNFEKMPKIKWRKPECHKMGNKTWKNRKCLI